MRPALLVALLLVLGAGAAVARVRWSEGRGVRRARLEPVGWTGTAAAASAAPLRRPTWTARPAASTTRTGARLGDVVHIRGCYLQAEIWPDNEDLEQPVTMRPDKGAQVTPAGLATTGSRHAVTSRSPPRAVTGGAGLCARRGNGARARELPPSWHHDRAH